MLQRLIAAVLGVLGLVVAGLGVASATAWRADDVLVADARTSGDTRIVTTDAGVLELAGDPVTVRVTTADDAPVVLAVGRDTDVTAWVGTDPHVRVTGLSGWHELRTTEVEGEPAPSAEATAPADAAAPADPAADPAAADPAADAPPATANPAGSDLWVLEESGVGSATLTWPAQPGRWSLVAVSLGEAAPVVEMSWPRTVTTPWLWPCVAVGSLLLLAGLALAARLWLRARRGEDAAEWHPVGTGPVPVVAGAGAGAASPAAGAATGETVVLTRRQLRDAGLTGETRSRRRDRAGRAATGEQQALPAEAPTRVARGTSPAEPGPSTDARSTDAPVPRWAAAAAAVPAAARTPEPAEGTRPPWGRAVPSATPRPSADAPAGPGRPAAPATGPSDRPSGAPAPAQPERLGDAPRGPAWAAQLGRRAAGPAPSVPVPPPGREPGVVGGPGAPAGAGRPAASGAPASGPGSRADRPAGPPAGWTPSAPVRPGAAPAAGPAQPAQPSRLPGPPGRPSHPDASPAGPRASWLPSGPAQPPGARPQDAPRARPAASGPGGAQPVPTRGPGPAAAQPSTAGAGSRTGVAAPHAAGGRAAAPSAGAPHHGSHAAPSEAPAARADAWRRAWGIPEPTDEQGDGPTNREGQR